MEKVKWLQFIETLLVALVGGSCFYLLKIPLPWILGSITFTILYRVIAKRNLHCSKTVNNVVISVISIVLGLFFSRSTITTVLPYIAPYLLITILILVISIQNSLAISKFINVDKITSVIGSVPGGLVQMVATSYNLNANVSMVAVLQTVRMLTVVFIVPFVVIYFFTDSPVSYQPLKNAEPAINFLNYGWYILSFLVGWIMMKKKIASAYIIGPLLATAILNIIGIELPEIPFPIFVLAQILFGAFVANSIAFDDLLGAWKYCGLYSILAVFLILISFGLGYLLYLFTDLSLATSILSVAPGGLVEMSLTATAVGADSSVVTSLQLVRMLFIILVVPSILTRFFQKEVKIEQNH